MALTGDDLSDAMGVPRRTIYAAFKKDCVSKSRAAGGGGADPSPYFAYFTWDDFVELAYSNHNHLESSNSGCPETVEALSNLSVSDINGSKFANFHGGCKASGSPTVLDLFRNPLGFFTLILWVFFLLIPFPSHTYPHLSHQGVLSSDHRYPRAIPN